MGAGERKNRSCAIDRYPDLKEQKLKEQQALNEMLGVNLSTVPTTDLVKELCNRYEVKLYDFTDDHVDHSFHFNGPAKVIVVRGDGE